MDWSRLDSRWTALRSMGTSRVLRSSYFWLLAVPIAAKFLLQIKSPLRLEFAGHIHEISIVLPFSWSLLYFAAVCFAVASFLFSLFCPVCIKRFATFADYYQAGFGTYPLAAYIVAVRQKLASNTSYVEMFTCIWESTFRASGASDPVERDMAVDISNDTNFEYHVTAALPCAKREEMGDLFQMIQALFDRRHPFTRWIIALFYLTGFALVTWVLFQNFQYVVQVINR